MADNKDKEKEEKYIEIGNRKLLAKRISCACCNKCWQIVGSTECIYGGPFSGYDKLE